MPASNNPASRMYNFFQGLPNYPDQNLTVIAGWMKYFNLNKDQLGELMRRIIIISNQLDATENKVREFEKVEADFMLRSIPIFRDFISVQLAQSWTQCLVNIKSSALEPLRYCSIFLNKLDPEALLEGSFVEQLKADINELINSIQESDLEEINKSILLDSLYVILRSLDEYIYGGPDVLKESIIKGYGNLAKEYASGNMSNGNPYVDRFFIILSRVNAFIGVSKYSIEYIPRLIEVATNVINNLS